MSSISGTNVAAPIVPFDTAGTFPTHDAQYGKGGYRSVATIAERDAIPVERRVNGMRVMVTADPNPANNIEWDLSAGAWVQAPFIQANIEAASSAADAEAAQVAAEAARDAAFVNADVYASTAAGIAGTTVGEQFQVANNDGMSIHRYRHDAGPVATPVGVSYPTADGVYSKIDFDEIDGDVLTFLDFARRRLGGFRRDGKLSAKFAELFEFGGCQMNDVSDENSDLLQIVDGSGRLLVAIEKDGTPKFAKPTEETQAARGTRASLSGRLAVSIRPDGFIDEPLWGSWNLRETARAISAIRRGATQQLVITCIGDSWTDTNLYNLKTTSTRLQSLFGDAGPGFIKVDVPDYKSATDAGYSTKSGSGWTVTSFTVPGVSLRSAKSSTPGDAINLTCDGADSLALIYKGGAGTVRYQYNAGSWVTVALSGSGTQIVTLAAPPAGAFTCAVEIVSGDSEIYGFDARKTANGVRVHNVGLSSSYLAQWAAVDAAQWQAGIAALGARLTTIMFGVNDAYQYNAATFAGHLETIIDRVRAATPLTDILLVSPPQTLATNMPYSMAEFQVITRAVAKEKNCAHLDLQMHFGQTPADYGDAGTGYIVAADVNHPKVNAGADVISSAILSAIKV